jgi:hypothetical protein
VRDDEDRSLKLACWVVVLEIVFVVMVMEWQPAPTS